MKTKEEILQEKLDEISKGNTTQIQFCYDAIFKAMNDYADQQVKKLNMPGVSVVREPEAKGTVCPHFDSCGNGGKNQYCDLQTFKEIDCFVGQTER